MSEMRLQRMEIGDKYVTSSHIVTTTDVEQFCTLAGMKLPIFLSDEYVKSDEERGKIVKLQGAIIPGQLSFAFFMGSVVSAHLVDDVIVQMATDRLKWPNPAYHYDELRTEIEITNKKTIKSGDAIVIEFDWRVKNQNDLVVCEGHNT